MSSVVLRTRQARRVVAEMAAMKLPKTVFVVVDKPQNDEEYLVVHERVDTIAELGMKRTVGKYVLEKLLTVEAEVKVRNK